MNQEDRSVIYLMSGKAHLPYLVVSLYTLRKHWHGDILVYAYPESYDIVNSVTADMGARCLKWEPVYRGKNGQFLNKIKVMQQIDAYYGIYLDADTVVNGDLDYLFLCTEETGFTATQFNDWMSNSKMIKGRISRLLDRDGIDQNDVKETMENPYMSVNGGVFACHPGSPVLTDWYDLTMKVKDIFIADETILHILPRKHDMWIAPKGHYNSSPKFKPKDLTDKEVSIWHGHGDSFVRPNKSPKGVYLWWPLYKECLEKNIGFMQDWTNDCGNRFLRKMEVYEQEASRNNFCMYCLGDTDNGHNRRCPDHQD